MGLSLVRRINIASLFFIKLNVIEDAMLVK
jgi:hypothetical protein